MVDELREDPGNKDNSGNYPGKKHTNKKLKPPVASKGVLQDIYYFFLHKPEYKTLVKFASPEEQMAFSQRIMQ